jgi:hypothetical protein
VGLLTVALFLSGCKDPSLADQEIPPVSIGPVETPYGLTLDENASPKDVAYVFLRAARDDYRAAQASKIEEQKAALYLQIALAAADDISGEIDRLYDRKSMPVQRSRDEAVYKLAISWTPTVAHYVDNFTDDRAAMQARMIVQPNLSRSSSNKPRSTDVLFRVSRDESNAMIRISLIEQTGSDQKRYWRIAEVGYGDPRPGLAAMQTTTP